MPMPICKPPKRFVILDRDGTLIVERNYLASPEEVKLLPHTAEGLRRIQELGWGRLVVTNQSGVGRGYFTLDTVADVHAHLRALLAESGATVDGFYICPHGPEEDCACRKPKTALVLQAAVEWDFDPAQSFFIGDKASDIELGRALGGSTILVLTGYGEEHYRSGFVRPDYVVRDLREAAEVIASTSKGGK